MLGIFTKQFRWIATIEGGLEVLFDSDPNVFVAGDLLWYPVKGDNTIRAAPDAMVVFGRPKGDRGSYMQWREDNIAPQVVFEVLSPGNTRREMARKFDFYQRYGVEEYYIYDPDNGTLQGWLKPAQVSQLQEIETMRNWISPRLNVRFDLEGMDLCLYRPDGERFVSYRDMALRADAETAMRKLAEQRAQNAEQELARIKQLLRDQGLGGIDDTG